MAFKQLHQPMNAEWWVTADEQVDVIGQDFHLDQLLPPPFDRFHKDR